MGGGSGGALTLPRAGRGCGGAIEPVGGAKEEATVRLVGLFVSAFTARNARGHEAGLSPTATVAVLMMPALLAATWS